MLHQESLKDKIDELLHQGKDSYQIKQELGFDTMDKELKRKLAFYITDTEAQIQIAEQFKSGGLTQLIMGGLLFIAGLGITAYTYFMSSNQYIIAYGAILSGIFLMKLGYDKYKTPIEDVILKQRKFKSKFKR